MTWKRPTRLTTHTKCWKVIVDPKNVSREFLRILKQWPNGNDTGDNIPPLCLGAVKRDGYKVGLVVRPCTYAHLGTEEYTGDV
jgi:hypothetical protein